MLTKTRAEAPAAAPQGLTAVPAIDVLIGASLAKLPELSMDRHSPTLVRGEAMSAFVKSPGAVAKMSVDTLMIHAGLGDSVNWQMTSICDSVHYNVELVELRCSPTVGAMTKAKVQRPKTGFAAAKVTHSAFDRNRVLKNYVSSVSMQAARCDVIFRVAEKDTDATVGYGIWRPVLMVRPPKARESLRKTA